MNELYERISAFRLKKGIKSDAELCRRADIRQSVLTELKHNRTKTLSQENLISVAAALGITIHDLCGIAIDDIYMELSKNVLEGAKKDPTSISADEVLAEELINRLCLLTDEELAKVDAFVQGLLASR